MSRLLSYRRSLLGIFTLALLVGGVAWQRRPLLAWYYARQLRSDVAEERAAAVQGLVALDVAAIPQLLAQLRREEPESAAGAATALGELTAAWGAADARSLDVAQDLGVGFATFSMAGQRAAVSVFVSLLRHPEPKALPLALTRAAGEVLHAIRDSGQSQEVLALAAALIERVPPGQWLQPCRDLATRSFTDASADVRLAAVRLTLCEPLKQDPDLLPKIVPLLRDSSAAVRRAALVTLASARELVSEEMLMPLLHDPDAEVQHLCEVALNSRGLQERDLLRARLISDESPAARLRVLQHLGGGSDLDLGVWLRRLTQDASPAVRAAAVRVAGMHPHVDLGERLREMAQRDPSETVRQNAQYYLDRRGKK